MSEDRPSEGRLRLSEGGRLHVLSRHRLLESRFGCLLLLAPVVSLALLLLLHLGEEGEGWGVGGGEDRVGRERERLASNAASKAGKATRNQARQG